jgi:hypothetical protein
MQLITALWQPLPSSRGYVVEQNGMLKTGSFSSRERAVEWFAVELGYELKIEGEYVEAAEEQEAT